MCVRGKCRGELRGGLCDVRGVQFLGGLKRVDWESVCVWQGGYGRSRSGFVWGFFNDFCSCYFFYLKGNFMDDVSLLKSVDLAV